MYWLDVKYIGLLSGQLKRFKRKSNNLYNFRCPFCNDSEKKQSKARGYVYERAGKTEFHCHNCYEHFFFPQFLKAFNPILYAEYIKEKLHEKPGVIEEVNDTKFVSKPKFNTSILRGLQKVSQLDPNHPIKKYVVERKIPSKFHWKLYAVPNYMRWINTIVPNKFSEDALKIDEMRLMIPFFSKTQEIHAVLGRSLDKKSDLKYNLVILDESLPKVYGLDTLDLTKKIYVVEGPVDSFFLSNCIAIGNANLSYAGFHFNKENLVLVFDNQPRNKQVVASIKAAIQQGYDVCIWPDTIQPKPGNDMKDINDLILDGITPYDIKKIIDERTFNGLRAMTEFIKWKRV